MAKYKCTFESVTSDGGYGIKDFKQWVKQTIQDTYRHSNLRLKLKSMKLIKPKSKVKHGNK